MLELPSAARLSAQRSKTTALAVGVSLLSAGGLALAQVPRAEPVAPTGTAASSVAPATTAPAPPSTSDPTAPAETSDTDAADLTGATTPTKPPATDAEARLNERLDALQAEVAELKAKQEEAALNALMAEDTPELEPEKFRLYGFMDMGFQRAWVDRRSLIAAYFETNSWTFVTGNLNLYFDFTPDPDWRGLAEVRFTGAPHGQIEQYGGITGQEFRRTNTEQFDPHATVLNAPMWGGYTVIERASIEWQKYQQFQLRTGLFFTPFGIWNEDHGSPTLISLTLPQFMQQKFFPLRQTGVQALGSFFSGEWEIAYRAWLSNGRTEENLLDYDDDKAFGVRSFVRKDAGDFRTQIGASYHHGHVETKVVDILGVPPVTETIEFESYSSVAYTEDIIGLDLSLDIVDTRIRAEYVARYQRYDEGKRAVNPFETSAPGSFKGDDWQQGAYLIVAQALPWWGLEPYLFAEGLHQNWAFAGDLLTQAGPGLNVRFSPAATLKMQLNRSFFTKWKQPDDFPGDEHVNESTLFMSRLVLAF
jgi:hypothetical protein